MVKYVDHIEIDSKIAQCKPNVITSEQPYSLFFFFSQQFTVAHRKNRGLLQHPQHPCSRAPATEVPLSKATNPQLLSRRRHINGCPLLRVCVHGVCSLLCVHFGWVKCRAQIPSMGNNTWPHVPSLQLFFNPFPYYHINLPAASHLVLFLRAPQWALCF